MHASSGKSWGELVADRSVPRFHVGRCREFVNAFPGALGALAWGSGQGGVQRDPAGARGAEGQVFEQRAGRDQGIQSHHHRQGRSRGIAHLRAGARRADGQGKHAVGSPSSTLLAFLVCPERCRAPLGAV